MTHCHCNSHRITTTCYIASFHIKHHLRHYSKLHPIPRLAIIPHLIAHFISHQHLSQHTSNRTISRIAPISVTTYHITPRSMYSTPHFRSHHIGFTQHCIAFRMLHFLHKSCIIPPHLTVIAPNSTSHYHVSHNIHATSHISTPPHSTPHHLLHLE